MTQLVSRSNARNRSSKESRKTSRSSGLYYSGKPKAKISMRFILESIEHPSWQLHQKVRAVICAKEKACVIQKGKHVSKG